MAAVDAAILIAAAVSDSLGDIRAWTLVAAVSIGYMVSRGLPKSGTKYVGGETTKALSDFAPKALPRRGFRLVAGHRGRVDAKFQAQTPR
jgi:hypothetical protein